MNAERWKQIDDLFQRALERAPEERGAFLRGEIGDDSELGREVNSLLEASERPGAFLDSPAEGGVSRLLALEHDEDTSDLIGRRFGAYRVASVIASGGMGTVFLARRDDDAYRKHVAIKLVKRSAGGSSIARDADRLRRFTLERQVLAELEHPFIARLIDGGTTEDGRPYLVMEHVVGLPIDEHCARHDLPLRARLALFADVCKGVQHAHQNLIIHRDLKPSNILVTEGGVPKLLDFGLAKLLDPQRSSLASRHTSAGQIMGTIAFAAPEQLTGSAQQQDTRSDVYALGVILYRVLTGHHPYSVEGSMSDVLRRITQVMPERPSSVSPRVGEELDTIVLKALAKEQDRRYQSAGDLAADVQRYLDGEPVLAKGDSRWYVLRKTARRYRVPIALAAAALVVLSVFAALMSVQAARLADRSAALAGALRTSNIERGRAMASLGSITEAEGLIWSEFLSPGGAGANHGPDRAAHWALWELYFNHPCSMSRSLDDPEARFGACSASGRLAGVLTPGAPACIIDVQSGEVVCRVGSSASTDPCIAFAPGDASIVTVEPDASLAEWAIPSGRRIGASAPGIAQGAAGLEVGAGRLIVAGGERVRVVDRVSKALLLTIELPGVESRHATMNPAETLIGVACMDGHVRTFEAQSGAPVARYLSPETTRRAYTSHVTFSPTGRYLAADIDGTDVAVIDLEQGRVVAILPEPAGWITDLRFHPTRTDPCLVMAGSTDKSVYVWEVPSGELIRRFAGHDMPVDRAMFTSDGARVMASGRSVLRQWDLARHAGVRRLTTEGTVFHARFSPDERLILGACGDGDDTVRVFDAHTGSLIGVGRGHTDGVTWIDFEPDGRSFLTAAYDGTVRRRSLDAPDGPGTQIASIASPNAKVNDVMVAPDGSAFLTSSDDGVVRLWDRHSGEVLGAFEAGPGPARVPSARFSPDGRWLALAVTPPNRVVLRDLRTGGVHSLPGHDLTIRIVRFSPDGSILASAGDDLVIRLWSMHERDFGRPIGVLTGHRQDVWALAFSADGRMLASSGRSGIVKLWDVPTLRCLATLDVHDDMVFSLEFSADGRTLLSGSRDRTIGVWDLSYYDRHIGGNLEYHRGRPRR